MSHVAPPRSTSSRRLLLAVVALLAVALVVALAPILTRDSNAAGRHRTAHYPTKFGASVDAGHMAWSRAVARSDSWYAHLDMIRVFYPGLPQAWPGRAGSVHRPTAVSFKASPRSVLSGKYDSFFTHWFKTAPRDRTTWWTYFHEPEDNIEAGEFSATQYRAAWSHLHRLSERAHNARLRPTLTLMCYTLSKYSHRNPASYYPGSWIRTVAFDCYNRRGGSGHYIMPRLLFRSASAWAHHHHAAFAVAEFGSVIARGDNGTRRARWLHVCARYLRLHHAQYVSYFDSTVGGDYRLTDAKSRSAWRSIVAG
jgi:hypothetical protein